MNSCKQRLFINLNRQRDLISPIKSIASAAARKALHPLNCSPVPFPVTRAEEDELHDVFLGRVKDEEEEEASAAVLFFDQPTPVIEMKSFLSSPLTGKEASTASHATRTSHQPQQQQPQQQPHLMFTSNDLAMNFDQQQMLQSSSAFGQQVLSSQSESLSTPVVNPDFTPQFPVTHTLATMANMESSMFDPFQAEQSDFSYTLQYAAPPLTHSQFMSSEQSSLSSTDHKSPALSHLPESVLEMQHRPSISSVGASESSSSQPSSPKTDVPDLKRKRSDSDCYKKSRMTKKQQLDALCSRKTQLEEENSYLKDKVDGYERACRRLKERLYNRIRQQKA